MGSSDLSMIQRRSRQEEQQRARRHDAGMKKSKLQKQTRSQSSSAPPLNNDNNNNNNSKSHAIEIYSDYDLYLAAKYSSSDVFRRILDIISVAEKKTFHEILLTVSPAGNTFIHVAAKHGNRDIVAYITRQNLSLVLKKNSNGETALHLAAKAGDEPMVKALVRIHRDLWFSNFNQTAESSEAAAEKNLLRAKNERGNTALHEALIHGWDSIAQHLIQGDPEGSYIQNNKGESAVYLAARAGFAKCFQSLQQKANFKENFPIRAAMEGKSKEVLKLMLKDPILIQSRDVEGRTPLHHAASLGFLEGVLDLLNQGVPSAYERDGHGSFPIHLASSGGHVDIVKLLLQHSYEPEELLDNNGRNILHVARSILNRKLDCLRQSMYGPFLQSDRGDLNAM